MKTNGSFAALIYEVLAHLEGAALPRLPLLALVPVLAGLPGRSVQSHRSL